MRRIIFDIVGDKTDKNPATKRDRNFFFVHLTREYMERKASVIIIKSNF